MEDPSVEVPRLLTVPEFAAALRVDRATVVRWIKAGDLAAHKPGRDYRIPVTELARKLDQPPAGAAAGEPVLAASDRVA